MTFHRIARAPGEAFDCDQLEGVCEGCDLPHSHCACDPPEETSCETCEGGLTFTGFCFACEDFGVSGWALAEQSAIQPRKAA